MDALEYVDDLVLLDTKRKAIQKMLRVYKEFDN